LSSATNRLNGWNCSGTASGPRSHRVGASDQSAGRKALHNHILETVSLVYVWGVSQRSVERYFIPESARTTATVAPG
jgi:hypothetical protein